MEVMHDQAWRQACPLRLDWCKKTETWRLIMMNHKISGLSEDAESTVAILCLHDLLLHLSSDPGQRGPLFEWVRANKSLRMRSGWRNAFSCPLWAPNFEPPFFWLSPVKNDYVIITFRHGFRSETRSTRPPLQHDHLFQKKVGWARCAD